jgi:hypothetical protein
MQNHRLFIEALSKENRLEWEPQHETQHEQQQTASFELLTAYKEFIMLHENLRGFWAILKLAQGSNTTLGEFYKELEQKLTSRL